jgi:putative DNA primase/helicase
MTNLPPQAQRGKVITLGTVENRAPKKRREMTDDAIALIFAKRHEKTLRYVSSWNKWFKFDGTRWKSDQTRHAFDLVRDLCRELARQKPGDRKALEAAKKINAVHTLAQVDRRLAAEPGQWDRDLDILNEGDES